MDRYSNIFYKITKENENASSELLCNILRTKYIRDLILGFLGIPKESLDTITLDHISTQRSIDGGGIPDIKIENADSIILIENKIHIGTELQDNQLTNYPAFISEKNKKYKGYIFLIPKNYGHEQEIEDVKKSYPKIDIKIKEWEELLNYLNEQEIQKESPVIGEAIDFLYNLISNESVLDTKLNINEVVIMYNGKDIHDTLTLCNKIINAAMEAAINIVKELGQDFLVGKTQENINGWGQGLTYKNINCIFLGLFPLNYGVENGDFLFGVSIRKDMLKKDFDINKDIYYDGGEEDIYIKIDRKTLIKEDGVVFDVKTVVDIINDVFLRI